MNDLTIFNRDNAPRQELIIGRRPYSNNPEDYVTYIEDGYFVNGPLVLQDDARHSPRPYLPPMQSFCFGGHPVMAVNWQEEGF